MYISGRFYTYQGTYSTWSRAVIEGKKKKKQTRKRWFIKPTYKGYDLYIQG